METTPLEDVLAGKEVVEQETPEAEAEEQKPEEAEVVEESESEAAENTDEPTGVTEEEPQKDEPPSSKESKEVPLVALLDERDKRKQLQAEIEELRKAQEKEEQKSVDFWENPQAALDQIESKYEEKVESLKQEYLATRLADSITSASYRHKDYDQYREAFAKAAEQNNALVDQALQSGDPGEYIYNTGRQFAQLDSAGGDIDSLREQIRQELMAEMAHKDESKKQKLAAVPTPITDETSASTPQEKVEGGPTPLDNIFNYNRG